MFVLCVASKDKQATYRTIKTRNQVRMNCEQSTREYKKKEKSPGGDEIFSPLSRPAVGPTYPPVQWVPGVSRGVALTTHPHLAPRLKKE
jgi:hypothetical protein